MKEFFDEFKKQILAGVGIVMTAVSGIVITQFKEVVGIVDEEETAPVEQVIQQPTQPNITINIPQQEAKKDTVVKVVKVQPKPKKTETEKRKDEGLDW
jgi:broad specificity polyphosphatase/5'/3'-nucleotidase SurE